MAQLRGQGSYGLGAGSGPAQFGGPSMSDNNTDSSPLAAIREQTSKIEDMLDTLSEPLKPYASQEPETHAFVIEGKHC